MDEKVREDGHSPPILGCRGCRTSQDRAKVIAYHSMVMEEARQLVEESARMDSLRTSSKPRRAKERETLWKKLMMCLSR